MPEDAPVPAQPPELPPVPPPLGPVAAKSSFTLPWYAWLAWAICTGALALPMLSSPRKLSAYQQGEMVGLVLGLFLFPTVAAWLVWRFAGRSAAAGRGVFFVVLAIATLGQVPNTLRKAKRQDQLEKMQAVARESKAELLASMDKDGVVDPEVRNKVVDKTKATLAAQVDNSRGEDREMALAMQALMARGMAAQQRQAAAMTAINFETFFEMESHDTARKRAALRTTLQQLKAANVDLRDFVQNGQTWLEAELARRHVSPAKRRSSVAGYGDALNRNMTALLAIRTADEELVEMMLEFVAFAETVEGQWSKNAKSGNLILPTDAALEKYETLVAQVRAIGEKQAALQKNLLAPKPAGN